MREALLLAFNSEDEYRYVGKAHRTLLQMIVPKNECREGRLWGVIGRRSRFVFWQNHL